MRTLAKSSMQVLHTTALLVALCAVAFGPAHAGQLNEGMTSIKAYRIEFNNRIIGSVVGVGCDNLNPPRVTPQVKSTGPGDPEPPGVERSLSFPSIPCRTIIHTVGRRFLTSTLTSRASCRCHRSHLSRATDFIGCKSEPNLVGSIRAGCG